MPVALTAYNEPYGKDLTAQRQYLHGLLTFTAQNYTTGGIVPVYGTILDQSGQKVLLSSLNVNPDTMWIQSISGTTSQFSYRYVKATGAIQIFTGGATAPAANPEFPNGTAITGILADIVEFEAEWVRA